MRFRMVLMWLVAALLGGCSDANDGGPNGYGVSNVPAPSDGNTPSTWTEVYSGVIQPTCSGCHNPGGLGGSSGKLDMSSQDTAYANLVNAPAAGSGCAGKGTRVTPSDTATSIMYLKVSPTDPAPCGLKMPLGGVALSQTDVDEIASWINAGAMNN